MTFNPQFARIGEILAHMGVATEDQVKEAVLKQNNFGLKLGETLRKLGFINEKDLLQALHLQLEYDIVNEDELLELDPEIVKLIPEPFAVENRIMAIKKEGETIIVAMTDPEDIVILDSLKKILGLNISPMLIGDDTLTDTLEKYYKSIRTT
ncbi:MAG: pilus assembly protein PilB, partial [Candidatus Cloacimonadota bacterium]